MTTQTTWISDRLKTMARLRRTAPPKELNSFASALTGFEQIVIDDVCTAIEREDKRGFPSLGRLLNECRQNAVKQHSNAKSTHWTVDRYRQSKAFDDWLQSEVRDRHKDVNALLAAHLQETRMWIAWRQQKNAGTLHCPGWCDLCEGNRFVVFDGDDGERYAKPCERCSSHDQR
jgi:hypothetical protein